MQHLIEFENDFKDGVVDQIPIMFPLGNPERLNDVRAAIPRPPYIFTYSGVDRLSTRMALETLSPERRASVETSALFVALQSITFGYDFDEGLAE